MNRSQTTTSSRASLAIALFAFVAAGPPTTARADPFFFTTNTPDGLLAALSQPAANVTLETETADDFILGETTTIAEATIVGLIPLGTPVSAVGNVEVEIYHVFPRDSVNPPSFNVPSRVNSPADVEIDTATRDGSDATLSSHAELLVANFTVLNTVVDGIHAAPANLTGGDGPATGEIVEITIAFTPPIVLPADRYFFRPEVQVEGGEFLFLSAPKPIAAPADLQAWIRNSDLRPDWLRIGTDIVGGVAPVRTFNMTVSLTGHTIPEAGTPGRANCHGKSISALSQQFGDLDSAAAVTGFSGAQAIQDEFQQFCGEQQLQKTRKRARTNRAGA